MGDLKTAEWFNNNFGPHVNTAALDLLAEIADLRAKLAEAERERDEARAVMLKSNANALRAQHDAADGDERWAREQARIAEQRDNAEARADRATAACAEMRAALVALESCVVWSDSTQSFGLYQRVKDVLGPARALLARTDLWRGMVAVKRDVVERAREVVGWYVDNRRGTPHGTRVAEKLLADLDALLDGGKGRG